MLAGERIFANFAVRFRPQHVENIRLHATSLLRTTIVNFSVQSSQTTIRSDIPGISLSGGFRFRNGQYAFLSKFADILLIGERNHLGVFVPGYGKTITALASFLVARSLSMAQKLVIFVPRGNLRDQYANPTDLAVLMRNLGAPPLTFSVADSEKTFLKNLSTDVIITTYQYASGRGGSEALEQFCKRAQCMFVFDEVHHLSEDGTWAMNIKKFPFSCSVALSGTPVRSDNKSLFGVPTEITSDDLGRATQFYKPLHEVLLRDAHAEGGVLKRVQAHVVDYNITLKNAETGAIVNMSLSQFAEQSSNPTEVDTFLARKQLRFHEVYLETLLSPAFEHFAKKRAEFAANKQDSNGGQHQMLIIAMSNQHSAAILDFVKARFPGVVSARIGQDLPERERAKSLHAYRAGEIDVMVQVDMIGEGTDIKPISIIVKADLVRAFSKTMQQIFRGMRYYTPFGEVGNICDIYTSNDSEVVQILDWLTSEEQLGVSIKTAHSQGKKSASVPQIQEKWDLMTVEHNETATHALSLGDGCMITEPIIRQKGKKKQETFFAINNEREKIQQALDSAARERELRHECLGLVVKLAQVLPKEAIAPYTSGVTAVHSAAMRRFSKTFEQLSSHELHQKRTWLLECMKEKRVIEG
jgi:superfamily II DNA or RNA helicase